MRKKPGTKQSHGEKVVKDIRRATRKQYSAEEKIKDLALKESELSPRELAVRFTDTEKYFVSEGKEDQ